MATLTECQLDTYLDTIVNRLQHLRQRRFVTDIERQHALEEMRNLQGVLAIARAFLRQGDVHSAAPQRRAA